MADRRAEKLPLTKSGGYLMSFLNRGVSYLMRERTCCKQLVDTSNLDTLRKMTLELGTMHNGEVPYYEETARGATELKIYEQSNVKIIYVTVKKATIFPEHSHLGERETIAVSKGKVSLETGALTVIFKEGEFIFLDKKIPHKLIILEDSILIITFLKTMNGLCNAGN